MSNQKGISWRAAIVLWMVLLILGGAGGLVIGITGFNLWLGLAIIGVASAIISIAAFYALRRTDVDPGVVVAVVVGVATSIAAGVLVAVWSYDSTPPTVSAEVVYVGQGCKETLVTVKVTATDPDTWRWDKGMSSSTIDGAEYPATPASGVWSYSFVHTFSYTACEGKFTWKVTAKDVAGNSATYTFEAPVPHPWCCNPDEARAHNCDCECFKRP